MQKTFPPKREDCSDRAHWKQGRIDYFKALKARDRTPPKPVIIERIVKVVERMEEDHERLKSPKTSPALTQEMQPGETPDDTRKRLGIEYRDLADVINLANGTAEQQARFKVLHGLEFELKGLKNV